MIRTISFFPLYGGPQFDVRVSPRDCHTAGGAQIASHVERVTPGAADGQVIVERSFSEIWLSIKEMVLLLKTHRFPSQPALDSWVIELSNILARHPRRTSGYEIETLFTEIEKRISVLWTLSSGPRVESMASDIEEWIAAGRAVIGRFDDVVSAPRFESIKWPIITGPRLSPIGAARYFDGVFESIRKSEAKIYLIGSHVVESSLAR